MTVPEMILMFTKFVMLDIESYVSGHYLNLSTTWESIVYAYDNIFSVSTGLQNDLKNIMKAIENGLHEIHEPLLSAGASSSDSATSLNIQKGADLIKELHIQKSMKKKPFAKITVVSVDSPAQQAVSGFVWIYTKYSSHFNPVIS